MAKLALPIRGRVAVGHRSCSRVLRVGGSVDKPAMGDQDAIVILDDSFEGDPPKPAQSPSGSGSDVLNASPQPVMFHAAADQSSPFERSQPAEQASPAEFSQPVLFQEAAAEPTQSPEPASGPEEQMASASNGKPAAEPSTMLGEQLSIANPTVSESFAKPLAPTSQAAEEGILSELPDPQSGHKRPRGNSDVANPGDASQGNVDEPSVVVKRQRIGEGDPQEERLTASSNKSANDGKADAKSVPEKAADVTAVAKTNVSVTDRGKAGGVNGDNTVLKDVRGPATADKSGTGEVKEGKTESIVADANGAQLDKKTENSVEKGGDKAEVAKGKTGGSALSAAATKAREAREEDVESEDDGPLDLAAMSAFEYAQVARLNPTQLQRYEQFRRSDLKNPKVKRVLVALNPLLAKSSDQYIISVKGLAKLFVGDIVEAANEVKRSLGDHGPLRPKHLREAYRRLRKAGAIPGYGDKTSAI